MLCEILLNNCLFRTKSLHNKQTDDDGSLDNCCFALYGFAAIKADTADDGEYDG